MQDRLKKKRGTESTRGSRHPKSRGEPIYRKDGGKKDLQKHFPFWGGKRKGSKVRQETHGGSSHLTGGRFVKKKEGGGEQNGNEKKHEKQPKGGKQLPRRSKKKGLHS